MTRLYKLQFGFFEKPLNIRTIMFCDSIINCLSRCQDNILPDWRYMDSEWEIPSEYTEEDIDDIEEQLRHVSLETMGENDYFSIQPLFKDLYIESRSLNNIDLGTYLIVSPNPDIDWSLFKGGVK